MSKKKSKASKNARSKQVKIVNSSPRFSKKSILAASIVVFAIIFIIFFAGNKYKPPIRLVKQEINGDPKVGEILFIRQIHPYTEDQNAFFRGEFNNFIASKEEMLLTGEYQYYILVELLRLKPKYLFVEGMYAKFANKPSQDIVRGIRQEMFPEGWEKKPPTPVQKEFLYFAPLPIVYPVLNPEVKLMITENEFTLKKDKRRHSEASENEMEMPDCVTCERREKHVARTISKFFKTHPGSKVILIFGIAHEFSDDFRKLNPLLRSLSLPELVKKHDAYDKKVANSK